VTMSIGYGNVLSSTSLSFFPTVQQRWSFWVSTVTFSLKSHIQSE